MKIAVNHMKSFVLSIDRSETINIDTETIYAKEEGWLIIIHHNNCIRIIAKNLLMLKVLIKKPQ